MTAQDLHPPGKYRLRIADYLRLAETGAFDDLRTELVEGDVIVMSPEFRPHMFVKSELAYRLRRCLETLGSTLYVASEGSVQLSDNDMPRPDITVTSEPRGEGAIPVASIALLVEVASTSLALDVGAKARIYANAAIPEYWIADLSACVIHQLWVPEGETYLERRELAFGQPVAAATVDGLVVDTQGL